MNIILNTRLVKLNLHFTKEDFDEIEKYIVERFNQIATYETLEDDDIPVCSEEERWYSGSNGQLKKELIRQQ